MNLYQYYTLMLISDNKLINEINYNILYPQLLMVKD